MSPESRLGTAAVLVTMAVVCVLLVSSTGLTATSLDAPRKGPEDVKIVTVDPQSQDRLWPYTSRQRRFETLTLPINVVVRGNETRVRWFLMTGDKVNWNESEGEWQGVGGKAVSRTTADLSWYEAHGATRYTYIQSSRDPYGGWVDESYQLHSGNYFGTRYHIRAYTGGQGNGSWTAIQTHHEHWDWFRLRHTVGSTADARTFVEQSFYGSPATERVGRERYANGGPSDSDGWVTVVDLRKPEPPEPGGTGTGTGTGAGTGTGTGSGEGVQQSTGSASVPLAWGLSAALLAGVVLSFGVSDVRRRFHTVEVGTSEYLAALVGVTLLTMPSLRWLAITAEQTFPWLPVKVIAGLGYLVIAVGLPVAVALLARETRADRAAPLAAVGLGAGVLLDYSIVGITMVPVSVMLHRLALVLTIGLFAAAGARVRTDRPGHVALPVAATVLWVGVLVWPILDPLLGILL